MTALVSPVIDLKSTDLLLSELFILEEKEQREIRNFTQVTLTSRAVNEYAAKKTGNFTDTVTNIVN